MAKQQRFVILDGSSLFFRAFFAMPPLTDKQGAPVGAIVGFANMLTKLLGDLQPDLLLIAFDKSRHTFRTEKYAAYKGTRDKVPEELIRQIPLLQELAAGFGIRFLEKDNYEADDIIGTLATQAAAQGLDTLVVTGDRDALQLVRDNLRVLLTKKGISELKEYDTAAFQEEYSLNPLQLIDLKGLMGDTSDNIPGVPGVGPKTASKLIIAYGSVENVLEHIPEIKGKKLQERLTDNKAQALLSKDLATIELAVPGLTFAAADYTMQPDHARMQEFCTAHALQAVWRNFTCLYGEEDEAQQLALVSEEAESLDLTFTELSQAKDVPSKFTQVAVAGAFMGSHPFERLTALAIAADDKLYYVEVASPAMAVVQQRLATAEQVTIFGLKPYYHAGWHPGAAYFDVQLAAYLLQPELSKYEIDALVSQYLPKVQRPAEAEPRETLLWQARVLALLQPKLAAALSEQGLDQLYATMELPLAAVLAGMEQYGVYVNKEHLQRESEAVAARLQQLAEDVYTLAGHEFNLNSPKQLATVLFEEMGLPPVKKTKTGYSTNAEVLETLRHDHPIVEQILQYRLWQKLKSTYLDGIAGLIHPDTGRVYTNFNQTVTATGRLSSSDPNLQNIPVRTEEGKTIRALFEPGEGYDYLLSADYSQIELRLLAHMSGDASFIDAFRQGQDIHARTAAEVFGVPLELVTPEMRRKAKAVNFGIVYGISDFGLARNLHIPRKEAAHYIATYFARYPGVRNFMDDMVTSAHEKGYVETMYGRRRSLPAINSRNFNQRSMAERMAMNTPIQGSAADIIKLAMIRAWRGVQQAGLKSRILLQVHDELVLELVNEERPQVEAILHEAMEQVAELSVPLVIDIHAGTDWAAAK
ncbi:MAG: DNA polymerase I [Selenomonas sp.]|nr:DNA polymerase I [Selenomonas sp.]